MLLRLNYLKLSGLQHTPRAVSGRDLPVEVRVDLMQNLLRNDHTRHVIQQSLHFSMG